MHTEKKRIWGICALGVFVLWLVLVSHGWKTAAASIEFRRPGGEAVPTQEKTNQGSGSIRLLKTDVNGTPLSGAEYRLLREVPDGEYRAREGEVQWFRVNGTWKPLAPATQPGVSTVVTGNDGTAVFQNLEEGTYYIQEVTPPAGFDPQKDPIEARVSLCSPPGPAILVETTKTAADDSVRIKMLLGAGLLAAASSAAALVLLNARRKAF